MGIVQLIDCDIGHNRAFGICASKHHYSMRFDNPHLGAASAPRWPPGCKNGPGEYNDANVGAGVMVEGFGLAVDVTLIGCDVHHNVR